MIDDNDGWLFNYFSSVNLFSSKTSLLGLDGVAYYIKTTSGSMETNIVFYNPVDIELKKLELYLWKKVSLISNESKNKSLTDFADKWSEFFKSEQ